MGFAYLTTYLFALTVLSPIIIISVLAAGEEVVKHCRFALEGQNFDICPILRAGKDSNGWTVVSEKQTPPTITKTYYRISLTGPLSRNASIPEEFQVIRAYHRQAFG